MSIYGPPNFLPDDLPNQNAGRAFPPADNNTPWVGLYTALFPGTPNLPNATLTAPIDDSNTPYADYDYVAKYGLVPTTSPKFGPYAGHLGTDVVANGGEGTPVLALTDGTVIELQPQLGGVLINDAETAIKGRLRYLHMREIRVHVGDTVSAGTLLGLQSDIGAPGAVHTHVDRSPNDTPNAYDTLLFVLGGTSTPPIPPIIQSGLSINETLLLFMQKRRLG